MSFALAECGYTLTSALVELRARLETAWMGNDNMEVNTIVFSNDVGDVTLPVHRFKIDEDENFVISTSSDGGLVVRDLDTHKLLFMLPVVRNMLECVWPACLARLQDRVRAYAHVEYSNGFFIFDRQREEVEVWRRSNDARLDEDHSRLANPDPFQLESLHQAYKRCPDDLTSEYERHRGTFVPYAVLHQPQPTRAYRFVYPTLLLASSASWQAFLWDVPSSSLSQTIDITPPNRSTPPHHLTPLQLLTEPSFITYVEQSEKHIFICTRFNLLIFTREPVEKGRSPLIAIFPDDNVDLEPYKCSLECDYDLLPGMPTQFGPNPTITLGRDRLRASGDKFSWAKPHNKFVAGK